MKSSLQLASSAPMLSYPPTESPMAVPDSEEHQAAENTVLLVGVMFLAVIASYFLRTTEHIRHYVPESAAAMMIGVLAGSIASRILDENKLLFLQFHPQVFFFIFLPPIVFDAGFSIKKKLFFDNLGSILLFAVFGTIISTFVVGLLTYAAATAELIHIDRSNPLQSLLFGALISSVDPVATLSIMGDPSVGVDPLVYSLVFGESVLNDAVAIVLFRVFLVQKAFQFNELGMVMLNFFSVALGSLFLGAFVGLMCCFCFRNAQKLTKHPVMEVQLLFLTAFGSFALGDLLNLSGVTALFTTGLTLSHYAFSNLSDESKISSLYVFESMAKTAEMMIFISIGLSLYAEPKMEWDFGFFALACHFCLIARALNIFPLAFLANLCRQQKISKNAMILMFFSGLRGSVSVALAMQLNKEQHGVMVVRSTTLLIVIATTLVLGGTAYKVIDHLGLRANSSSSTNHLELREDFSTYLEMTTSNVHSNNGSEEAAIQQQPEQARVATFWHRMDDLYMKPFFGSRGQVKKTGRKNATVLPDDVENSHSANSTERSPDSDDNTIAENDEQ